MPVRVSGDGPLWRLEYGLPGWPLPLAAEILVGQDGAAWISSAVGGWQRLRALVPLAPALEGEWQVAASEPDTLETVAFAPEETRFGRGSRLPSVWVDADGAGAAALLDFKGSVRELRFDGVAGAWAMATPQTDTVALYRGAAPGWADAVARRGQQEGPPDQWPEILRSQTGDQRRVLGLAAHVMVEHLSVVAAVDPGGVQAVYDQSRASFGLPAAKCPFVEAFAAAAAKR
jgi:hypothetical protein